MIYIHQVQCHALEEFSAGFEALPKSRAYWLRHELREKVREVTLERTDPYPCIEDFVLASLVPECEASCYAFANGTGVGITVRYSDAELAQIDEALLWRLRLLRKVPLNLCPEWWMVRDTILTLT